VDRRSRGPFRRDRDIVCGQQLGLAVAVEIDHLQCVNLGVGFVDGVAKPMAVCAGTLLLQPVESIAVALTVDDVHFAVIIDVIANDGKSSVTEIPVRVPLPLIVISVDLSKPSIGRQDIRLAISVHIGNSIHGRPAPFLRHDGQSASHQRNPPR